MRDLLMALIRCPSITPEDAGCQRLIIDYLAPLGFTAQDFSTDTVTNHLITHGTGDPFFIFSGHTDVVPPGDVTKWTFPPFEPTEHHQALYGRGATDMKSGVAAMVVAMAEAIRTNPEHAGTWGLALTSDEEGVATEGTCRIVDYLKQSNRIPAAVLVGEATSEHSLGDTIKIGRRGSLHGTLVIHGKQGHIAYPHLADNPIHRTGSVLTALSNLQLDSGNAHFPPSSLQCHTIRAGTGANNVIPAELHLDFNVRFSTESTAESIEAQVRDALSAIPGLRYTLTMQVSAYPYYSGQTPFSDLCQRAIQSVLGIESQLSTVGGTSDARFFASLQCPIVELGPKITSAHQTDEHIACTALTQLPQLYTEILEHMR